MLSITSKKKLITCGEERPAEKIGFEHCTNQHCSTSPQSQLQLLLKTTNFTGNSEEINGAMLDIGVG